LNESFNNLLEFALLTDENKSVDDNGDAIFQHLMTQFFFKQECREKKILGLFKKLETPVQFSNIRKITEIPLAEVEALVQAETINETFAGKIMLSKQYLKSVYPQHEPEFKRLPTEVQLPLIDRIKDKNSNIIQAFKKMYSDIDGDKKRTVLKLIALVIKNVHLKTGFPLKKTKRPVVEILKEQYNGYEQIFNGDPSVVADLNDDKKIRFLAKEFFLVHNHKDIVEIGDLLKKEFQRFEWRMSRILDI
jgi:hypothetical protein